MSLNSACSLLLSNQFNRIKNIQILNQNMDIHYDQYINHVDEEVYQLKSILVSITFMLI